MAKKAISQKRADREKQDNQTLHRVFNVFLLGLAAECYLFIVYRGYGVGTIDSVLIWHKVLTWGMYLGLVMLVGGAIAGCVKRSDRRVRTAMTWVGGIGLFLAASGWIITNFFDNHQGITAMCILVPILTVMGLVFLLYQHECFLCTLALSCAMFTVWARGATAAGAWRVPVIAGCVLGIVLLGLAVFLASKAQKGEGKLGGIRVLSLECDYRVLYGVLGLGAVGVLVALIDPAISVYLMWVLGILLFAELVYYTTKLM